ncbi:MAG: TolC family protein [Acidobacteriaceae bacterium]|nr:TolC family protein [Acidobacteriaceae bacterium]
MDRELRRPLRHWLLSLLRLGPTATLLAVQAFGQHPLTWPELKARFEATNPTLKAAQANIAESRAEEITAYLRPNPDFGLTTDGFQINPNQGVWRPFAGVFEVPSISYLHERQHKRELRLQSAKQTTDVTISQTADQERSLIFNLRNAFVQVLQAKSVLENAKDNLAYWDRELTVNHERYKAGDIAEVDYDRLVLQRVQFESDYQAALVNLRTAKITLLQLLNDRTSIEQFDVTGPFDFSPELKPLQTFRTLALQSRPDLKAAVQSVDLAKTNYQLAVANGSTDPTFGVWFTHNASIANPFANNTMGASINIPLRIFDRNQGEKARTRIDISRNERLRDAAQAQVFNDVDSAYVTLESTLNLLRPYKEQYLALSLAVRDKVAFAYQRGGASLLDYLDAEKAFRDTRLAYVNLVGSYLVATAQMNMAVGTEVFE